MLYYPKNNSHFQVLLLIDRGKQDMTVEQIECTKAMFRGKTGIVLFLFACELFECDLLTVLWLLFV